VTHELKDNDLSKALWKMDITELEKKYTLQIKKKTVEEAQKMTDDKKAFIQ
jgi:hypothetical protein